MADVLATATVVVGGQVDPSIANDVSKSLDKVDDVIDDLAENFRRLEQAVDETRATNARAFGELSEGSNLARDGFGDLSTAASAVGSGLVATGLISEGTGQKLTAVADTLGGVEGAFTAVKGASALAGSAISGYGASLAKLPLVQKAVALGQKALNLVLAANPIGLVIAAVALLVAGFVIAYKKSETFRKIVDGSFQAIKTAAVAVFGFISRFIRVSVDAWLTAFRAVKNFVGTIWDGLRKAGETAFNGLLTVLRPIAEVINKLIRGFNGVTPGTRLDLPEIPKFASGVRNFRGGLAVVGEQGPELVALPAGSDVYSNRDSQRMGSGMTQINNYVFTAPESFTRARQGSDWSARWGSRFGAATQVVTA